MCAVVSPLLATVPLVVKRGYLIEAELPVVPKRKQRTWYGLSEAERRQVRKAARRGESHPVPVLALAAFTWARDQVSGGPWYRWLVEVVGGLLDGGGSLGVALSERRTAKRILRARPPRLQPPPVP